MGQPCIHCGKPAIKVVNGFFLCVDCFCKVANAENATRQNQAQAISAIQRKMEFMSGIPLGFSIVDRSEAPIIHQNNINITNSNVGVVNTGYVDRISSALEVRIQEDNGAFSDSIKELVCKIIEDKEQNEVFKNDILEQLATLTELLSKPRDEKNRGAIKAVLSYIPVLLNSAASLTQLWEKIRPLINV